MHEFEKLALLADQFEKLAKNDPKAKVRNRGKCVFPAEHPKVNDDKDHYPIGDKAHAKSALQEVGKYTSAPKWYDGTLESLKNAVHRAVKKEHPSIGADK